MQQSGRRQRWGMRLGSAMASLLVVLLAFSLLGERLFTWQPFLFLAFFLSSTPT